MVMVKTAVKKPATATLCNYPFGKVEGFDFIHFRLYFSFFSLFLFFVSKIVKINKHIKTLRVFLFF